MQRKEFLKTCTGGCLLALGLGFAGSIARAAEFPFEKVGDDAKLLVVSKERFLKKKKKKKEREVEKEKQKESELQYASGDSSRSLSPSDSSSRTLSLSHSDSDYRPYIIIYDAPYEWPIVLYRFSDTEYSALLMRCTHQGNELSAHGEMVTCAAHGSEFDTRGQVVTGPAETPLQTFEVSSDETNVYIHLL